MLRASNACFAAMVGGADSVTPLAFDAALGPASELGRRLSRNTALVLSRESHLGRVLDPAGGSYYVESLTTALSREAWAFFQQIEGQGGMTRCLVEGGWLAEQLADAARKRSSRMGSERGTLVGVTAFVDEQLSRFDHSPPNADEMQHAAIHHLASRRREEPLPATQFLPFETRLDILRKGAWFGSKALHPPNEPVRIEPLPSRRDAAPFEEADHA
jgi:methylmalonyl-CoA mutase